MPLSNESVLARMPKTELHLYLEGTVRPEALWDLSHREGVPLPGETPEALRAKYAFDSFAQFVELWLAMHSSFVDATAYERMVDDYIAEARRQNVRHAETHFTPYNHETLGRFGGLAAVEVVTERLQRAESVGGPVVRLIFDINSAFLHASGECTAALVEQLANPILVLPTWADRRRIFQKMAAALRADGRIAWNVFVFDPSLRRRQRRSPS